jgi:putative DNA primase/helicase
MSSPTRPEVSVSGRGNENIRDAALAILDAGVSLVPINWTDKLPASNNLPINAETGKPGWKIYQSKAADRTTVRGWFDRGVKAFAVVGGKVSGGLVIMDFDEARFFDVWKDLVGELIDTLVIQRSGREGGGYHVAFRCPEPVGNLKLAWVEDVSEEEGRKCAIETKGEGGYLVAAPSLHPTKRHYELITGDWTSIPTIPQEQADILIAFARDLDEMPLTKQQVDHAAKTICRRENRNDEASVIDKFNDTYKVEAILKAKGYVPAGDNRLKRPGGASPSVKIRDGISFHWSSNDQLNDGRFNGFGAHDAFDAYRLLEHGGDLKAAVKAAAARLGMAYQKPDHSSKSEPDPVPSDDDPAITPVCTRLSDVTPRPVEWLWHGRIALGKITLIVGDPGLGKSFLTCDLAARVSTGTAWPDDICRDQRPADVILLNAEDGLDDTVRPRLDAAGADVSRIVAIEGVSMLDPKTQKQRVHLFNLARDLPRLRTALKHNPQTKLVIVDPVSAFLGQTDSHSNAEVRGLLAPLAELAAKHRVAMVLISHLNKGGGPKSVYRVNGSLAFPAAARAAWLVAKDQLDADRRLFLPIKNNLARDNGGLAYRIDDSGKIVWDAAAVTIRADDVLAAGEKPSKCDTAEDWLAEYLRDGPKPVKEIDAEAEAAGINNRTLRRAREGLGIRPRKAGFGLGWCWALPNGCCAEHCQGGQLPPATEKWSPSGADGHLREIPPKTHALKQPLPPREGEDDQISMAGTMGTFKKKAGPKQGVA